MGGFKLGRYPSINHIKHDTSHGASVSAPVSRHSSIQHTTSGVSKHSSIQHTTSGVSKHSSMEHTTSAGDKRTTDVAASVVAKGPNKGNRHRHRDKRLHCKECQRDFATKSKLDMHKYLHLDVGLFKVELEEENDSTVLNDGRDLSVHIVPSPIDFTTASLHRDLVEIVGKPDEATKKNIERLEKQRNSAVSSKPGTPMHSPPTSKRGSWDEKLLKGMLKKADGANRQSQGTAVSGDIKVSFPLSAFEKQANARNRGGSGINRPSSPSGIKDSRTLASKDPFDPIVKRLSINADRRSQPMPPSSPPLPAREYIEIRDQHRQLNHQRKLFSTIDEPQRQQQQQHQQQLQQEKSCCLSRSASSDTPRTRQSLTSAQRSLYNPALPSLRNIDHEDSVSMGKLPGQQRRHTTHLTASEFAQPAEKSIFRPSRHFNHIIIPPQDGARDVVRHRGKLQESFAKAKDAWANFLDGGLCKADLTAKKKLEQDIKNKQNVHFDGCVLKEFPVTEQHARPFGLVDGPRMRNYKQEPVPDKTLSQFRPNSRR